jgi:hypothetical protein
VLFYRVSNREVALTHAESPTPVEVSRVQFHLGSAPEQELDAPLSKGNSIPVTDHGGPYFFQTSWLPHFLVEWNLLGYYAVWLF